MAAVTLVFFDQFHEDRWKKLHELDADTIKVAFVTSTLTLTAALADPRWGAGGTNNLSTNEVSAVSANYTAGGTDITAAVTRSGNSITFDATTNPSWTKDAVDGFTDARYFVIYNATDAGKRAIAFGDMASDQSLAASDISLTWHPSGLGDEKDQ